MNDLIWYSIPGAIVIMPFIQTHSDSISSEKWLIGIIIVGIPVVGFIIHQMWRTIYESFGGFKSNRRKVIRAIIEHDNWGIKFKEDAFLVWELTFYSKHRL